MKTTVDRILTALEWVEGNLDAEITVADVARRAAYSTYHFHRIFTGLVGKSVMEYVRRRRLTMAADRLRLTNRRIVEVAFDCGFGSQEAFTRAFRQQHGITPGRYRKDVRSDAIHRRDPLTRTMLETMMGGVTMEPRFVEMDAFKVMGQCGWFTPETTAGIGPLWERFALRTGEIPDRLPRDECYGVCFADRPGTPTPEGSFFYMPAVAVESFDGMPADMVGKIVPANRYAAFTHEGGVSKIMETWAYIWGTWLPQTAFEPVAAPDLEIYDDRYDPETGDGVFDILLPIREAAR